ncbi:hypothetical protein LX73_2300 [Fodinibius salinus]|uniref:Uncharacterized protein n=1 Tax=Fodinibius salinus TaxID=860790 RepID=A0A5D3YIC4_9BACT|nr:hypothetical protein [Fodinibius salinus]TYP92054.1 hypothetical protein LX73_2300 [Fodinibius salinus]
MTDHQILYTKPMILAKLNGWKTVTRRPIKPQPKRLETGKDTWEDEFYAYDHKNCDGDACEYACNGEWLKSPYGVPGDQLWTKENYTIKDYSNFEQSVLVEYTADQHQRWVQFTDADWQKYRNWEEPIGKKSKLFMFKTLSRFWDEVTDITVERIQDITPKEVWNEGIRIPRSEYQSRKFEPPSICEIPYLRAFHELWQSMYEGGPFDWNNDPYVWAISYTPLIVNHDTVNEKATVI